MVRKHEGMPTYQLVGVHYIPAHWNAMNSLMLNTGMIANNGKKHPVPLLT